MAIKHIKSNETKSDLENLRGWINKYWDRISLGDVLTQINKIEAEKE